MKIKLKNLIILSLKEIMKKDYQEELIKKIEISETKNKAHGDYSTNVALILSNQLKKSPKKIAELMINSFGSESWLDKSEIAGPGFINFFLSVDSHLEVIPLIHEEKESFGKIKSSENSPKILVEYVSSNPTGPLHVGHGRGAAYGSSISSLLRASGYQVEEEYYVNDFGRQMDILTTSVAIRYLQIDKPSIILPENCYQGDYIIDIAKNFQLKLSTTESSFEASDTVLEKIRESTDDKKLDELIYSLKELVNSTSNMDFLEIKEFSLNSILDGIKKDLNDFGVNHNTWFFESSLYGTDQNYDVDLVIDKLEKNGHTYKKNNAVWFKSSKFGDDKDRVIVKDNQEKTYFASDIAYHLNKYDRGFDEIINIWGSDHHGYLPRVKASMQALEKDTQKLQVIFIQFANLIRNGKKTSMSTRGGQFVSLDDLVNEVSSDAARFFYIMRRSDQHLDFDLDLAKKQSKDNPLYYIQYAHARICSLIKESSNKFNAKKSLEGKKYLKLLTSPLEIELSKQLNLFPSLILNAAHKREPHLLCYYLKDLSSNFHSYYNNQRIIIENKELQSARILLVMAIKQVIANGLNIIGVSAPESM